MATFDDLFGIDKEKYPEEYAEQERMREEVRRKIFIDHLMKREKAAFLLRFQTDFALATYLQSLDEDALVDHRSGIAIAQDLLERRFCEITEYDRTKGKRELLQLVLKQPASDEVDPDLVNLLNISDEELLQQNLDRLTIEQIVSFYRPLHTFYLKVDRAWEAYREKHIFSRSKTTLKALMNQTPWQDVDKILFERYKDQTQMKNDYIRVYGEFQKMATVPNKENMVIIIREDEDGIDVSGIKPGERHSFAIEFQRWEEWLGQYVSQRDIEKYGAAEIIAHVLWEMTYAGFYQDEIQEQFSEILTMADDIKGSLKEKDKDK